MASNHSEKGGSKLMIDNSECEKELPDIKIWPGEVDEVHMSLKHDGRGKIVKTSHQHFLKLTAVQKFLHFYIFLYYSFSNFHRVKTNTKHWRIQRVGALSPICFIFMQFSAQILPNDRFLLRSKGLSPTRLENPGSASAKRIFLYVQMNS